ncbi:MAG: Capsular exopolysaccharide family [Limisphaerales bacterium]|nr:MAG: Capsular exopolysaccharide family [Limisphaerales bacterium]KAG0507352.1 MAG: Capsular exopolysaccharide family [Limisphaerales bacterium]TXT51641.1 MAG: Capsular exopolysaccharide family [Limisphaerales bacterium]
MYVAIASKHLRTIILLVTLSLTAGLLFYIFSRPVYFSKSVISYTSIGTGPAIQQENFQKGERGERFSEDLFLKEFDAEHICVRVDKRLGDELGAARAGKSGRKQVRATWTTDHNIELNVHCYIPSWVTKYPEIMIEEFQKEREERARSLYHATTNKYMATINEYLKEWQKQQAIEQGVKSKFDPDRLKFDLAQLNTLPAELARYTQAWQEWEQVRRKLLNPAISVSDRLQIYSTIDYSVQGPTMVEVDPGTKERVAREFRPSNGTVVIRPQRSSDSDWLEIEQSKLKLERTIREESVRFRPSHPKMVTLYKQYEALDKSLQEELRKAEAKFEYHGRLLATRLQKLQQEEPLWRQKQKEYEKYLEEMNLITQGQTPYPQIIGELQKRMTEAALAINNERVALKFKEFDLPIRDEIPISPNRLKIVLMSLALGLGLAIGVPFLLEFMDQTVTNVEKMEEATNIRGLGIVPDFEDTIAEAYPLIFSDGVANPDLIENFRVVRTNLLSSAATSKFPQVIMITSTSPKEGKTVVASNLAMSFAQMGEKTLILDANLRRGIQHHLFGSRSAPGLSNILMEKYDVADACRPTTMENLHILPSGDQLEGDIEQLGSPAFVQVIDQLRKRYQRIIVDSPPVLGLAETSVMQPAMDGVMLVIWSGQTPTRAVRTAMEMLEANHANFYGFVLNRLDLMATMNRFHYYYYTNHYYNRYQSLTRQPGS